MKSLRWTRDLANDAALPGSRKDGSDDPAPRHPIDGAVESTHSEKAKNEPFDPVSDKQSEEFTYNPVDTGDQQNEPRGEDAFPDRPGEARKRVAGSSAGHLQSLAPFTTKMPLESVRATHIAVCRWCGRETLIPSPGDLPRCDCPESTEIANVHYVNPL